MKCYNFLGDNCYMKTYFVPMLSFLFTSYALCAPLTTVETLAYKDGKFDSKLNEQLAESLKECPLMEVKAAPPEHTDSIEKEVQALLGKRASKSENYLAIVYDLSSTKRKPIAVVSSSEPKIGASIRASSADNLLSQEVEGSIFYLIQKNGTAMNINGSKHNDSKETFDDIANSTCKRLSQEKTASPPSTERGGIVYIPVIVGISANSHDAALAQNLVTDLNPNSLNYPSSLDTAFAANEADADALAAGRVKIRSLLITIKTNGEQKIISLTAKDIITRKVLSTFEASIPAKEAPDRVLILGMKDQIKLDEWIKDLNRQ